MITPTRNISKEERYLSAEETVSPLVLNGESSCLEELESLLAQISNNSNEWDVRVNSIKKVIALINGGAMKFPKFTKKLANLSTGLIKATQSLRSTLVKQSCFLIVKLATELGKKFYIIMNDMITPLSLNTSHGTQVIADSCKYAILSIARFCQTEQVLSSICILHKSRTPSNRQVCAESLCIVLDYWKRSIIDSKYEVISESLQKLLKDSNQDARLFARKATITIFVLYPKHKQPFLELLNNELIRKQIDEDIVLNQIQNIEKSSDGLLDFYSERIESAVCDDDALEKGEDVYKSKQIMDVNVCNKNNEDELKEKEEIIKFKEEEIKLKEEEIRIKEEEIKRKEEELKMKENQNLNINRSINIPKNVKIATDAYSSKNQGNKSILKKPKTELRTPDNAYIKLSKMGYIKTPEIEDFSPTLTPPRASPKMHFVNIESSIKRSKSPNEISSMPPIFNRNPSPIFQSDKKPTKSKNDCNSSNSKNNIDPISNRSKRFSSPIGCCSQLPQGKTKKHSFSLNIQNNNFQLDEGNEMKFLHKLREYTNTGRNLVLTDSIKKIIPSLIVCSVNRNKKISSLSIRLIFELIKTFPEDFEDSLPSLFEILFSGLPSEESTSCVMSSVNLILKEIQSLYDPNLLLKIVSKQFPSLQVIKFVSYICNQPGCDFSDDELCNLLINIALRNKIKESKNILISIAKQNQEIISKAESTFPIDKNYFETVLNEISDENSCSCVPSLLHFTPNKVDKWIEQVNQELKCIEEYDVNQKVRIFQEIERAFHQTNNIAPLFSLISDVFEAKGIGNYQIFICPLLKYFNDRKVSNTISQIFDKIWKDLEDKNTLMIELSNKIDEKDEDITHGALFFIGKLMKFVEDNSIIANSLNTIYSHLNCLMNSKNHSTRRYAVKCYVDIVSIYKGNSSDMFQSLSESQKKLILFYCAKSKNISI